MLRKVQATDPMDLPVARGGASYRAREFSKPGHEVELIAPQYLNPAYSSNLIFGVPRGRFVALGPLRCVR